MHVVACEFARAVVRSKDAQKQLARTSLLQFQLFVFYKSACLQKNFHGRALSIRTFSADGHYCLNSARPPKIWWVEDTGGEFGAWCFKNEWPGLNIFQKRLNVDTTFGTS